MVYLLNFIFTTLVLFYFVAFSANALLLFRVDDVSLLLSREFNECHEHFLQVYENL